MAERTALGGTLVLGGGFAGGYVARLLDRRGATIVSPENFMLYTPMLPEAAPRRRAVAGEEHVWALGDGARVPKAATPETFDSPTCQHALRQARRLAKDLVTIPEPYDYRMLGQAATLARYKGTADVPGARLRGFPGSGALQTKPGSAGVRGA